ncbi:Retrotransposon gag protein [Corchorus olitorius]|uniref:Retrotransposon gag protein n=1 Tax=Corchorus olitorius TaxID=93759 RepID=A0A1R3IL22_9ROSI|nr:Retrotransposon gag protein [Corchorus olitorius]
MDNNQNIEDPPKNEIPPPLHHNNPPPPPFNDNNQQPFPPQAQNIQNKRRLRDLHLPMISNFQQKLGEAFHEAWERFRELLSQCPHHLFSDEFLVQRFYDGLTSLGQSLADMACNGDYGDKTADEMKAIYARLASNSQQKVSEVAINKWVHRVSVHLDLNFNNFVNNNLTSKTTNNKTLNPNLKFKTCLSN